MSSILTGPTIGICDECPAGYTRLVVDPNVSQAQRTNATFAFKARHEDSVSPISTLEIARLISSEQLHISLPLMQWVMDTLSDLDADTLPLTHDIAAAAYRLRDFHKDSVDRQLVATAQVHGLTLVTADERILSWKRLTTHDARR